MVLSIGLGVQVSQSMADKAKIKGAADMMEVVMYSSCDFNGSFESNTHREQILACTFGKIARYHSADDAHIALAADSINIKYGY